ncbi:CRISPR-associated protein Cas4 / CRISPR-associated protein Cas1 multi-domain protein [Leptospira broomii serovar Hurstbridge str. 5399]|uniref:CRISPR-associated endonuclease Cas1 n=1 Tax=Leptospira broomii serovar Hurstbridge str. 5399 TaxID=1049789 RepID=T0FD99_9LEPT|nr:type I-MYXAN CRISPR-associated endonuclease Cas4/Cas1 [Leptospira broomii]EQA45851.1 CRISPR-associated protein Cas4 / CRISPR-associated protein Cas1 multi-domain protein [Leptospira broomii serovar Hurstbridge str. 5399]
MGIHSLLYCERLFYLEEVEGVLIADDRVYAGRTLHEELEPTEDTSGRIETFHYTSEKLEISGKVDRIQKRDGDWIPYEHKRGRARIGANGPEAWESDKCQVTVYALLLEEATGRTIQESKIRYHGSKDLVRIEIDEELRLKAVKAINRAKELSTSTERPPVTENENLCKNCSLAPVCLPEETRVVTETEYEPVRLFPEKRDRATIHVFGHDSRIKKSANVLLVENVAEKGEKPKLEKIPIQEIESVNIHGNCQISSQTIKFLAAEEIPIHWFSGGGNYIGGININPSGVQRRIRQFKALTEETIRLNLTKKLVSAKCESQLRYLLRATRGKDETRNETEGYIGTIRNGLKNIELARSASQLLGIEGSSARAYFSGLPTLIKSSESFLIPNGRSKRPPKDPFNAALSFFYSLLYKSVRQAIISVGLDPSFGFYHTPRSSAEPLVLDLMELFRVSICDMTLIGSINRKSWNEEDFEITKYKVWLSEPGRKKATQLYELRLDDSWKHPVVNYSLSYYRMIELETRLLEKEWSGEAGIFAQARLR